MAQKITYNDFGLAFIKEGITPMIIQKSLNKAIQPRRMSGSMDQSGAKVSYTAIINDASVAYTAQIGVYNVNIPIEITVEVKVALVTTHYHLNAYVPFTLMAETYAPLVIFINYVPVQESSINVTGSGGSLDPIYKQVMKAIPGVLATEVNKALANSYNSRVIDILKSINASMSATPLRFPAEEKQAPSSVNLDENFTIDFKNIFDNAPAELFEINNKDEVLFATPVFSNSEEVASTFSGPLNSRGAQRLTYQQFGLEFLRLVVHPQMVLREINKSIAQQNIKSDLQNMDGHTVAYRAVLNPATITANAFGVFTVTLSLSIQLHVAIGGVWNEAWSIEAQVPFGLQVVPYSNPLLIFLAVDPVNIQNIRILSKQQSWTGFAWGEVEKKLYPSLQNEVNKALAASNKDRTINIVERIAQATNSFSTNLTSSDTTPSKELLDYVKLLATEINPN